MLRVLVCLTVLFLDACSFSSEEGSQQSADQASSRSPAREGAENAGAAEEPRQTKAAEQAAEKSQDPGRCEDLSSLLTPSQVHAHEDDGSTQELVRS